MKLFFADASGGGESAPGTLEAMRHTHERTIERLREVEAAGPPEGFAYVVLRYGIEFHEWMAGWCERTRQALGEEEEAAVERRSA